ncbi:hypothetical protein MFUL124B02_00965 [Myxococcus fulvus 124B02]|nr:hypothetical protein MFUL124B02_00965 [Myxococcus fulvus 124B02]
MNLVLVNCPLGAVVANYDPPLTQTPRATTIDVNTTFPACVTLPGSAVTSASIVVPPFVEQGKSCSDLTDIGTVAMPMVLWNTGETSSLKTTQVRVATQGTLTVVTGVGTVVAGKFQGAIANRTLTFLTADLTEGCLAGEGLSSINGQDTLTLTRL